MNIDFDKLYLNAVENALKSSEDLRDKFPESDSLSKQLASDFYFNNADISVFFPCKTEFSVCAEILFF